MSQISGTATVNVKEEIVRLRTCVLTNIGEKNDTLDHNFSPE